MSNIISTQEDDNAFKRMLTRSLILHIGIIVVFAVKSFIFSSEPLIVESAIRVDMVALPDKAHPSIENTKPVEKSTTQLPPNEKAQPAETKEPPKVTAVPLKKDAKSIDLKKRVNPKEALKKMKALQAIEDSLRAEEQKKRNEAIQKAREASRTAKGNEISPGTSLRGLNKIQYDAYIHDLDSHVKSRWALPEWLANSDFSAVAVVKIDKNGNVISRSLVHSSGNSNYDSFVMKAIDDASPFPVPPEKFTAILENVGIRFTFP